MSDDVGSLGCSPNIGYNPSVLQSNILTVMRGNGVNGVITIDHIVLADIYVTTKRPPA